MHLDQHNRIAYQWKNFQPRINFPRFFFLFNAYRVGYSIKLIHLDSFQGIFLRITVTIFFFPVVKECKKIQYGISIFVNDFHSIRTVVKCWLETTGHLS